MLRLFVLSSAQFPELPEEIAKHLEAEHYAVKRADAASLLVLLVPQLRDNDRKRRIAALARKQYEIEVNLSTKIALAQVVVLTNDVDKEMRMMLLKAVKENDRNVRYAAIRFVNEAPVSVELKQEIYKLALHDKDPINACAVLSGVGSLGEKGRELLPNIERHLGRDVPQTCLAIRAILLIDQNSELARAAFTRNRGILALLAGDDGEIGEVYREIVRLLED